MCRLRVRSARTYFYMNEMTCEKNMENFIKCVEAVPENTSGFAAIKLTALGRPQLLLQVGYCFLYFLHAHILPVSPLSVLNHFEIIQLLFQLTEVIVQTRRFMNDLMGGSGSVLARQVTKEEIQRKLESRGVPADAAESLLSRVTETKERVLHMFPWSGIIDSNLELSSVFYVPDLTTGKMVGLLTQLSSKEEEMFRNMVRRVSTVMQVR